MDKKREIIKNCYEFNFRRELTDDEVSSIVADLDAHTESVLASSELGEEWKRQLALHRRDRMMVDSSFLFKETTRSVELFGKSYMTSTRCVELLTAALFAISARKLNSQLWDIWLPQQDEIPDLVLAERNDVNSRGVASAPIFMEVLELMPIPKEAQADPDAVNKLVRYIVEKKFIDVTYGPGAWLAVNVGPNSFIRPLLAKLPGLFKGIVANPFAAIFIIGATGTGPTEHFCNMVYPGYSDNVFDPIEELKRI